MFVQSVMELESVLGSNGSTASSGSVQVYALDEGSCCIILLSGRDGFRALSNGFADFLPLGRAVRT